MSQSQPSHIPDYFPDELPRYRIGQVVRHRRYDYRGVIVDFDMSCHADEQWYRSNQTHPDPDQPWYHVLVHDSTGNTYVAEENLVLEDTPGEVVHPLLEQFFEGQSKRGYHRNDVVWPAW